MSFRKYGTGEVLGEDSPPEKTCRCENTQCRCGRKDTETQERVDPTGRSSS